MRSKTPPNSQKVKKKKRKNSHQESLPQWKDEFQQASQLSMPSYIFPCDLDQTYPKDELILESISIFTIIRHRDLHFHVHNVEERQQVYPHQDQVDQHDFQFVFHDDLFSLHEMLQYMLH